MFAIFAVLLLAFTAAPLVAVRDTSNSQTVMLAPGTRSIELDEDTAVELAVLLPGEMDSIWMDAGRALVLIRMDTTGRVHLVPAPDSSGTFRLAVQTRIDSVTTDRHTIEGRVRPVTDLRIGHLESVEAHEGRPGVVRVLAPDGRVLAGTTADARGRVRDVQLPENLAAYRVQAFITQGDSTFGFVRTIDVAVPATAEDLVVPTVRALSYDGLAEAGISPHSFAMHVEELTGGKIRRWEPGSISGAYVVRSGRGGTLTDSDVADVRALWSADGCVAAATGGASFPLTVGGGEGPFSWTSTGGVVANRGWLVIAADRSIDAAASGNAEDVDRDGRLDRGRVLLNPDHARRRDTWTRFLCRETIRALGMDANAHTMPFHATIMTPGLGPDVPDEPTEIDRKVARLLYEPSIDPGTSVNVLLGIEPAPPGADTTGEAADSTAVGGADSTAGEAADSTAGDGAEDAAAKAGRAPSGEPAGAGSEQPRP